MNIRPPEGYFDWPEEQQLEWIRADRRRLRRFLATPRAQRAAPDVAWVRELLDEHGCIQAAVATAADLAHAARGEAERALAEVPDSPDRDFLLALPDYVISRQR